MPRRAVQVESSLAAAAAAAAEEAGTTSTSDNNDSGRENRRNHHDNHRKSIRSCVLNSKIHRPPSVRVSPRLTTINNGNSKNGHSIYEEIDEDDDQDFQDFHTHIDLSEVLVSPNVIVQHQQQQQQRQPDKPSPTKSTKKTVKRLKNSSPKSENSSQKPSQTQTLRASKAITKSPPTKQTSKQLPRRTAVSRAPTLPQAATKTVKRRQERTPKPSKTSPVIKHKATKKRAKEGARKTSQSIQIDEEFHDNGDLCQFCKFPTEEDFLLGELKKSDTVVAHKFCLFFACGLTQNGELEEGIDGFLLEDIRKELKRGSFLKCSYCGRRGAVVGCKVKECRLNYHLPCGLQNGAFNLFHHESHSFPSMCAAHRPQQSIPPFKGQLLCTICQEKMKPAERDCLIHFSCCSSYFHRDCISRLAYYQGEFHLKCPNCKNEDNFKQAAKDSGIYVRCCDWDLTHAPARRDAEEAAQVIQSDTITFSCSASVCQCGEGRQHNGDNDWELFACDRCGANAIHVACARLPSTGDDVTEWSCEICSSVD